MNKQTLTAATVLIVIAVGAVALFRASGRPDIRGTWISQKCLEQDGKSPIYTKRGYKFTEATWTRTVEIYKDADCAEKDMTEERSGEYEFGDKMDESGSYGLHMQQTSIKITAHNITVASVLEQVECGGGSWDIDSPKEISNDPDGHCLGWIDTKCEPYKDIVKKEGDALLIGETYPGACFGDLGDFNLGTDQLKKSQ